MSFNINSLISQDNSLYLIVSDRQNRNFTLLVDSGAAISVLKEEVSGRREIDDSKRIEILGISGTPFTTVGEVRATFKTSKFKFGFKYQVLPRGKATFRADGIIGSDFLQYYQATLNYGNNNLVLNHNNKQVMLRLNGQDNIYNFNLQPRSRNYVQVLTRHNDSVYIEEKECSRGIILHGCVQRPRLGILTLIIDNLNFYSHTVSNLSPTITKFVESRNVLTFNAINKRGSDINNVNVSSSNRIDDIVK